MTLGSVLGEAAVIEIVNFALGIAGVWMGITASKSICGLPIYVYLCVVGVLHILCGIFYLGTIRDNVRRQHMLWITRWSSPAITLFSHVMGGLFFFCCIFIFLWHIVGNIFVFSSPACDAATITNGTYYLGAEWAVMLVAFIVILVMNRVTVTKAHHKRQARQNKRLVAYYSTSRLKSVGAIGSSSPHSKSNVLSTAVRKRKENESEEKEKKEKDKQKEKESEKSAKKSDTSWKAKSSASKEKKKEKNSESKSMSSEEVASSSSSSSSASNGKDAASDKESSSAGE